ncbi:MAG: helix-turn-helix transcriptional regulator [Clostridia bacterium]|nr:helix-turn-helix transcriptional regulator [Clostridia bacterium]
MDTYFCTKSRIFEPIEERHLSIHALAIKSGVAPSTIKNILYGKSKNPGVVTLKLLCDGLGISLFDFFDTEHFRSTVPEDI